MKIEELEGKWSLIDSTQTSSIRSLRVSSEAIPDLFIGLTLKFKRCLILKLPENYHADFKSSVKQNLSLELFSDTRWIILTVLDERYNDLFDNLIFSIYNRIYDSADANYYVSEFVKIYYKWSEFFQDNQEFRLSDDTLKGLFGELVVINDMIRETTSEFVNDVLDSWRGPFDNRHDFVGDNRNIEVKAKSHSAISIKISSEFQLHLEIGKVLELAVVNINIDSVNGKSIMDLVLEIRETVISKLGDFSILLRALSQFGLTMRNLENYDNIKFNPVSIDGYLVRDHFPRLNPDNLHKAISRVSYTLNLSAIQQYKIFEKIL